VERVVFNALRNQLRLCRLIISAPSAINQAIVFGEADPPGLHSSFVITRKSAKSALSVVVPEVFAFVNLRTLFFVRR